MSESRQTTTLLAVVVRPYSWRFVVLVSIYHRQGDGTHKKRLLGRERDRQRHRARKETTGNNLGWFRFWMRQACGLDEAEKGLNLVFSIFLIP